MKNGMKWNSLVLNSAMLFLMVTTAFARADVSLRNGNFYVSFRDISYPGGSEPKFERIYNSQTNYTGMFGGGWGNEYETRLQQDPDGSLLVSEYGGGADNRFVSKNFKNENVDASVNRLVEVAKKSGMLASQAQVQEYQKRLKSDYDFRARQYSIFVNKGTLPKVPVQEGSQFLSTKYLYQYITKVKGGYVRVKEGGDIQKFNEAGRLVQIMDRNKNFINFEYDKNGRMIQLIDNQNRKMVLTYNQQNLVDKIVGESGKYAMFKYSPDGLLAYSRDDVGEENSFAYTKDVLKNLSEIGYLKTKDAKGKPQRMQIAYYGRDKDWAVKSVVNRDGSSNEYEYFKDQKDPYYQGVRVLNKDSEGNKLSDSRYDYYSKIRATGEVFTSRMVSDVDGDKTETVYDEKLGFPVKIVNGTKVTTIEYDSKGRITRKVTPIETTELVYDPAVGKPTKVVRKMKSGTLLVSEFAWDKTTGNLVLAKNNEGKEVRLVHDQQGRIRILTDKTGRKLTITYNENSKPVEIKDSKLGSVKFGYKNSGEMEPIPTANGGANVALEIMGVLGDLTDIMAPSGVSMSI
jgi:YD repeat-containing protein